jgi:hypothetical protein
MSQDLISTLLPVVLIGAISLGIGGLAGFLLASLQSPASKAEPKRGKSLAELARLWRDRRSGKLWIESGGQMYESVNQLSASQRAEITMLFDELQIWAGVTDLEKRITLPPASVPLAAGALGALPPVQAPATQNSSTLPPPLIVDTTTPVKSPTVADILTRAVISDKKEIKPPKSIAAQVDEIVQERLPTSPYFNRTIKLLELPGRGLVVVVDGVEFEGVGEVTDPAVQAFLRECVAEWERRTEVKKK